MTTARLTRAQRFVVWYLYREEQKNRARNNDAVFETESGATTRRQTMLALQNLGIVRSRVGKVKEPKRRGGRGVIHRGYLKERTAILWSLTDTGREIAPSVKYP